MILQWSYDLESTWEADSQAKTRGGVAHTYEISVGADGIFSVAGTLPRLMASTSNPPRELPTYTTLFDAQEKCSDIEQRAVSAVAFASLLLDGAAG